MLCILGPGHGHQRVSPVEKDATVKLWEMKKEKRKAIKSKAYRVLKLRLVRGGLSARGASLPHGERERVSHLPKLLAQTLARYPPEALYTVHHLEALFCHFHCLSSQLWRIWERLPRSHVGSNGTGGNMVALCKLSMNVHGTPDPCQRRRFCIYYQCESEGIHCVAT